MEFQLAEHVGFCAVWIVSLAIYALAFRYYMPVMVLPNLFVLVMAFVVSLVVAGKCETSTFSFAITVHTISYCLIARSFDIDPLARCERPFPNGRL